MKTESEWESVKQHFDEVRQRYFDIGAAGVPALAITLNPLLVRYEFGERSDGLYEEMKSVE